jgi:hypothetical protein
MAPGQDTCSSSYEVATDVMLTLIISFYKNKEKKVCGSMKQERDNKGN